MFAKELFNVVFSKIKSRSKMRFLLEVFEFFEKRYHQKRLPFNHFPKRRNQILGFLPWERRNLNAGECFDKIFPPS